MKPSIICLGLLLPLGLLLGNRQPADVPEPTPVVAGESVAEPQPPADPPMQELSLVSTADGTPQPSLLWVPPGAGKKPLLLFLHSWSSDYKQDNSRWLTEAKARGWIWLHPDFRGPNRTPSACGSPLAQQDILDALDHVLANYSVDTSRIYLAGVSGGGHMTLLMAGKYPHRFSAASAWVAPTDLAEWQRFHSRDGKISRYGQEIMAVCGGKPGDSPAVDEQYKNRSPVTWLEGVGDLPLDINHGIDDGHTGSVPPLHALWAFNAVARAQRQPTVSEAEMNQLWTQKKLTAPTSTDQEVDPLYERAIHLRRQAGQTRVTIFEGKHESLPPAACTWLSRQQRETRKRAEEK